MKSTTTNNVSEITHQCHRQFQNARTEGERQQLVADYKVYYAGLSDEDRIGADAIHDAQFAQTYQMLDQMEPVHRRAKEMLHRYETQPTANTTESGVRQ